MCLCAPGGFLERSEKETTLGQLHPKKLSKSNGGHKTLQAKVKFSADQDNSSQHFKHEMADYTLKTLCFVLDVLMGSK